MDKLTHFTKHEAEDESSGRLIPKPKECLCCDPKGRGRVIK